jgi:hypothetical protein
LKDLLIEMVKKDLNEQLSNSQLTLAQVHMIMRQAIEKMTLHYESIGDKRQIETLNKYFNHSLEIEEKRDKVMKQMIEIDKELALNDKKMFEAIQNI